MSARGRLRYWAAARAAAGTAEEAFAEDTLAGALEAARARHSAEFGRVLDRCAFVVNGTPVGRRPHAEVTLPEGATVEVLPPFAGGAAAG